MVIPLHVTQSIQLTSSLQVNIFSIYAVSFDKMQFFLPHFYAISHYDFFFYSAPKPMQDGWGGGGDEMNLSGGQWDAEDGDMWNSAASQESNSSCNSWGNASKKIAQKVSLLNTVFCAQHFLTFLIKNFRRDFIFESAMQ